MKSNKLLTVLALCAAMQSNVSLCSNVLRAEGPMPMNKSYWSRTKDYAASWVPQSVKNVGAVAALKKNIMVDRLGDFFKPSIVRQYKQAARGALQVIENSLDGMMKLHKNKASYETMQTFAYTCRDNLQKALDAVNKIGNQAIKEGFTQDYLMAIERDLFNIYGVNKSDVAFQIANIMGHIGLY